MGSGFRATVIAIGVLLTLIVRPAKADSFTATGQTNFTDCAAIGQACSDISYRLDITTNPLFSYVANNGSLSGYYLVTAISGEINGGAVLSLAPAQFPTLLAFALNYNGQDPIPDGGIGFIGNDYGAGISGGPDSTVTQFDLAHTVRIGINPNDPQLPASSALATWNIVRTPEPSTLQFLGIGLLGLTGLTLLKSRLR